MTTLDHFQSLQKRRDLSAAPSLVIGALLLLLFGLPALMAPEHQADQLEWHGNAATTAQ